MSIQRASAERWEDTKQPAVGISTNGHLKISQKHHKTSTYCKESQIVFSQENIVNIVFKEIYGQKRAIFSPMDG